MTTIVTRSGKGSPLTNTEVDTNFTNLNTDKLETSGGSLTGAVSVAASTTGALVRITQTGTGDALLVEDSANPDSSPFVVDATGNVGIGTTAPANKLAISAASGAVNATVGNGTATNVLGVTSGNAGLLGMTSNHELGIYTNNTVRMTIQAAGNVGVGTSSPGNRLDIVGAGSSQIRVKDGVNATAYYDFGRDGTDGFFGFSGAQTTFSGYKWSVNAGTEAMRITNAGNVGIGTSSPSARLGVSSNRAAIAYSQSWDVFNGATFENSTILGFDGSGTYFGNFQANPLRFLTNNLERMRIDASGNVGIGTSSPDARLDVSGNIRLSAAGPNIEFNNGGAMVYGPAANSLAFATGGGPSAPVERARITSSGAFLVGTTSSDPIGAQTAGIMLQPIGIGDFNANNSESLKVGRFGGTGALVQLFYHNGSTLSVVGSISTNGSSTSYNTSSDYRLKENVTPLTDAAARVQALKPSRFNFIVDPGRTVDGFIAHEVADVVPEAVTGSKDAVDEDGKIIPQGIDQSKLVPLLTAALQEALTEIASLKARVAALENK